MVQVRAGHVGMDQHGDDEAAKGGLRQGFGKYQVGQRIGLGTAVLAVVHEAEQAVAAHLAQDFTWHAAGLFPGCRKRLDLAGNETRDLIAQQLVFGGDVDVVHGDAHMRNTPKRVSGIG